MSAPLSTAARVALDHRIAEERMIELDPPFTAPDWLHELLGEIYVPYAIVMNEAGIVQPQRILIDEVQWSTVVAFRIETPGGSRLDREDFSDEFEFPDGEI